MKTNRLLIVIAGVALLVGCASVPPPELVNARQAFQHASSGDAARLVPAELHKAEVALAIAEQSFQDKPKSFITRDLAYVADRKAKMAEALATTAAGTAATASANKDYQAAQTQIVKNTKEDLAASERASALKTDQLAADQQAGVDAEARRVRQQADADAQTLRVKDSSDAAARNVKDANDAEARRVKDLADAEARRLAEQKKPDTTVIVLERGKRVVLNGVNFDFNKATLRRDSDRSLTMAYNAMLANPDVQVEISGHTDNIGSQQSNQVLSLKRAQAVRNWLVDKGIASNRMKAVGKGQNEPVDSNDTDAGRAENRRIEFYVQQ